MASILSLATYSFLDALVFAASRVSHLPYDELPVLADYDRAAYLAANSFPYLDPSLMVGKARHLFFGLIRVYSQSFTVSGI